MKRNSPQTSKTPKKPGQHIKSEAWERVRIRREKAYAVKLEIDNAKKSGELIPRQEVEREWLQIAYDLRVAVLAVPARVAANLSLDRAVAAELDAEIRLALEVISQDAQSNRDDDII